ncbi:MAG: serine/threonine protein kinase, partial [Chloroflexota bacterium]|nr:serine/threonine protein kinase [Chloroflexota bacterium]
MELIADLQTSARHAQAAIFSPDGGELVTVGQDPAVKVWSVPEFELVRSLEGHSKSVNCGAFTKDGATLVTGSTDRTVCVWDFRE